MALEAVLLCASVVGILCGLFKDCLRLPVILCLVAMYFWGWISAHNEVATECETVGTFHVNGKSFTCNKKP